MPNIKRSVRYRCIACGNLTRFTITSSLRLREYHHFTIGGDLTVEDSEKIEEVIEKIECRWCADGGEVEIMEGPDTD